MQERNALFRELMGLGLYSNIISSNDNTDSEFNLEVPSNGKENSCGKYLKGTYEEIRLRAIHEPRNEKLTNHPGKVVTLVNSEEVKDFLLSYFDSDSHNLKPLHYELIADLVKYIDERSRRLNAQGTTAKFVIHLQGFASLSNIQRPGHNCLLSWMRREMTKEAFYGTELSGRIRQIEQAGNIRYIMHDHGFFKAERTGDAPEERKVRISIGNEDYKRPELPIAKKPSVFKVRCIELKDYPFPDEEAINLFLKYFADIDLEVLITNLLNRITSGYWAKNLDKIKDPIVKEALKKAVKLLLDQLKKKILDLKIIKELIKKWKLDKTYKGAKELTSALKALLLFINVGMRKGEFEIESAGFPSAQKEKFFYVGIYLEVLIPKIPIIDKGLIGPPVAESGDPQTLFKTFTINGDGTRSPYEMNVDSFAGNAYVEIGSRMVFSRPKKGFLSFNRLNKNFSFRVNNITIDEFNNRNEINFKLPANETTLRFSPSQGVFIKE